MSLASNITFLSVASGERHAVLLRPGDPQVGGLEAERRPSRVLDFQTEVFGTALPSTRPTSRRVMLLDGKPRLAGVMNRVSTPFKEL